jgi:putative PEP-CTERM system histidine kinase
VLIEQLSRNANAEGRRALLPLLVGVGGILVCDLALYAELLLDFRLGGEVLALRGFANAACVPAIALAARRNPAWSIDVFVSRDVVYYSATLLAVGSYLLLMAAGGYLVAAEGGAWGAVAQWLFLAGAAVLLVILVASDLVRKRLRVFLNKHFYRNKYDYRREWLRFVDTLEVRAPGTDALPAMVRAVAQIIGSRAGVLWTRSPGENRLVPAASWTESGQPLADAGVISVDDEFLAFLEQRQWIVDLDEYRGAPGAGASVALPEAFSRVAGLSLIVPLMQGARLLGLMGLGRPDGPFVMQFEDRDLLKTVGRHVGTHLAQYESDQRLTESRQFEAYTRLTAFVMHDLKNLLAQLSLVVANADKHRRNPAFVDDAIDTIRHSTERMTRLIEQLNRGEVRTRQQPVALRAVLERVIERCRARPPVPELECRIPDAVVAADPDRLMTAIEHLVRNGQDAAPKDGRVLVSLDRVAGRAVIQVADTGVGMSAEFIRERLFRPFDSTKGAQGMGIGAYQVRDYVRSLQGQLSVDSRPGGGSEFTISLPLCATEEQ